ncbi:hypothetical protein AB4Y95_00140 [Arthrobacter sp. M-10]|uniref:hypothetical protein n=1 Tax=Arthrobacter sp. M-10 TaxID=3233037 RepID=UPI003F8E246B
MSSIALHKRVSLAGIADGWDECFAVVSLATYEEGRAANDLFGSKVADDEGYKFQTDLVTKHFVSGKVLTVLDDGTEGIGDLTVEDATTYIPISNRLFFEILGIAPDPKDLSTPTVTSATNQPSDSTSNTKTT